MTSAVPLERPAWSKLMDAFLMGPTIVNSSFARKGGSSCGVRLAVQTVTAGGALVTGGNASFQSVGRR